MEPQKPESVGDAPTISEAPNTGDSPTALDSPANGGDTGAPTLGDTNATLASAAGAGAVPPRTSGASDHPSMIGHYRILRLLGEGGMGSVYLAEQENPHRIVAFKVIKPGFVNAELLRRFEQEANALGRLQHAGIAQIYEAGTADSGFGPQPFFAMEFIAGRSLTEYAEDRRLNARDRLELIAKVCDAVNHAHQRGIIHRDLKPGNILVDAEGQPKILDFGVARVTDSDTEKTRQTDLGQLIGTLAYMSPEQVVADPLELDIRSDVYALGVITYELLAGKLPYDTNRKALHEVVQAIRETDPARLSSVERIYRGDVETIVAKALEKDKTRRYASAAELAADIRRYLADEPIVARPPSTIYQLKKFARRNRTLVAGAAAVVLVLIAGVIASTWQAVRARRAEAAAEQQRDMASTAARVATAEMTRAMAAEAAAEKESERSQAAEARTQQERNVALSEKQRADSESASAKAVNDFLQNDLLAQASAANQSNPTTKPDPDLKVRTALDRAAERINGKFDRQPEVEAAIRDTVGQTYLDLGLHPEARKQLELALALHRRVDGPENPKTLNAASRLAVVEEQQGKLAEAEALQTQTSQTMRRVLGPENRDTLKSMTDLAGVYMAQGKYTQAEALFSQTLEIDRRVLGPEDFQTLRCMDNLGAVYLYEGKYAQAEAVYIQTLKIERRVLGAEHPSTLLSMNNLGDAYSNQGKYSQAEAVYSQLLEMDRRVWGPEHPDTLLSMNGLADAYKDEGECAQAEALVSRTLEISSRTLGPENPATLSQMHALALTYTCEGKYAQAEALFSQALEVRRRVLGPEHPSTLRCISYLAYTYSQEGRYAQAEALLIQNLNVERRVRGLENVDTLKTLSYMASMYQVQGKYSLAETYAALALAGRQHTLGPDHPQTMASAADLVLAYQSQEKFTESEPLARATEAIERTKQPDSWQRFWAESLLGASLVGEKKYAEAEPLLLEGYRGMLARKDRIPVPNWLYLDSVHAWIVQLYEAWAKPEKAAAWKQQH